MWNAHRLALLSVALFTVLPSARSQADVRVQYSRHRSRVDVDIDSLKGRLLDARRLLVEYEIEIEDARQDEAFDLVIEITPRGRRYADPARRPITFVVPLDHPTDYDDDEMEFETRVVLELPDGAHVDPYRTRLHARVVLRGGDRGGGDRVLDHKDTSIKRWRRRSHRRHYAVNFGFAYHH